MINLRPDLPSADPPKCFIFCPAAALWHFRRLKKEAYNLSPRERDFRAQARHDILTAAKNGSSGWAAFVKARMTYFPYQGALPTAEQFA